MALVNDRYGAAGWSLDRRLVVTKPEGTADSNYTSSLGVPMKIQVEGTTNPEVLISISDATATEGPGVTADFVVTLNRKSSGTVTVDVPRRSSPYRQHPEDKTSKTQTEP